MNNEERDLFECVIIDGFKSRKFNGYIKRCDNNISETGSIDFVATFNHINSLQKFERIYSKIKGVTIEKTTFFRNRLLKFDLVEAENQLQKYLKNKAQEIYNRLQAS